MKELKTYFVEKGYRVATNSNWQNMNFKAIAVITNKGIYGGLYLNYDELKKILEFGPTIPEDESIIVYV